jgi:hypothetical protein
MVTSSESPVQQIEQGDYQQTPFEGIVKLDLIFNLVACSKRTSE